VAARSKAWFCGRSLTGIVGSNPGGKWMSVSCEYYVLSSRSLCVGLITRPEESYRVWCVWVWLWILDNEEALAQWGVLRHGRKNLQRTGGAVCGLSQVISQRSLIWHPNSLSGICLVLRWMMVPQISTFMWLKNRHFLYKVFHPFYMKWFVRLELVTQQ
jgi:hypothetical protein